MAMQAKTEQVVQAVVTGGNSVEELLNGGGISGFQRDRSQSGRPFNVITMTVARPTAAEQTMHPASMSENSC